MDLRAFILAHTEVARPALCPEIRLALITERCPLWEARAEDVEALGIGDPYWAFAWAGGQALARHVLDHPEVVRGRTVLDFGAGSGLVAIAAALAGARAVLAADVDPLAAEAVRLNAELNGVAVEATDLDLLGLRVRHEVVLAGDVTYEEALTRRVVSWLRGVAGAGARVLVADPGRALRAGDGVTPLLALDAPDDGEPTGARTRPTTIYAVNV